MLWRSKTFFVLTVGIEHVSLTITHTHRQTHTHTLHPVKRDDDVQVKGALLLRAGGEGQERRRSRLCPRDVEGES